MATDNFDTNIDRHDAVCNNTAADDGSQATSNTTESPLDTPPDTIIAIATDAVTELSTSADNLRALSGENMAKFTDLPMEVLVMIAELLLEQYLETRPKEVLRLYGTDILRNLSWCSDGKFNRSFFVARKVNQAMRYAARKAFFQDDLWMRAHIWAAMGIEAMKHRLMLEERFAYLLHIEVMQIGQSVRCAGRWSALKRGEELRNGSIRTSPEDVLRCTYQNIMCSLYTEFQRKVRYDRRVLLKYRGSEPLKLSTEICYR